MEYREIISLLLQRREYRHEYPNQVSNYWKWFRSLHGSMTTAMWSLTLITSARSSTGTKQNSAEENKDPWIAGIRLSFSMGAHFSKFADQAKNTSPFSEPLQVDAQLWVYHHLVAVCAARAHTFCKQLTPAKVYSFDAIS